MPIDEKYWNKRNRNIKKALFPIREQLKKVREEESDELKSLIKQMSIKQDSILMQFIGQTSDLKYLRQEFDNHKEEAKGQVIMCNKHNDRLTNAEAKLRLIVAIALILATAFATPLVAAMFK